MLAGLFLPARSNIENGMAKVNDPIDLEKISSLTLEQVNGYLTRFDAENPCGACKHDQWVVDEFQGKIIFVTTAIATSLDSGLIYLPLACERCGNTRFINAANIALDVLRHEANNENQ